MFIPIIQNTAKSPNLSTYVSYEFINYALGSRTANQGFAIAVPTVAIT